MMKSGDTKNKRLDKFPTSLSNLSMPQIYNNSRTKCLKRSKSIVMDTVPDVNTYYQDMVVNNSILVNQTQYMTSEKFHALNRDFSYKSVAHSNSTLFYDLDQIAKRHSYHCVTEVKRSNSKACKNVKKQVNQNGFRAKSEAIVQECATNIQPPLKTTRDSFEIITGKLRKQSNNDSYLSSEIFLKDNDNTYIERDHYNKELKHHQKLWSYAKYRTEYTNPISNSKKCRKKDTGKRTEDPCPCQLFSYACPCTHKKSLTELAKNSKSITVLDQVTSTSKATTNNDSKISKSKRINEYFNIGGKKKNAHNIERIHKVEMSTSDDPVINILHKPDISKTNDSNLFLKNKKSPLKAHKKQRQVICPNCKEKVDVISTADEEESIKSKKSPVFPNSDTIYTEENPNFWLKNHENNLADDDICIHNPPCELVPVCQILPIDQELINSKSIKPQQVDVRTNPRTIRITKACRHHPPCTVVPSCQRINVLKNNCEFIPPCLHRPRCMNLPLCVPISKTIDYKVIQNHVNDIDNTECMQASQCKYFSMYQHDSLNNNAEPEFHAVQNTCEYLSEYSPRFIVNPKIPCMSPTFSPCQVQQNLCCKCCKSDKSCQYDVVNSKVTASQKAMRSTSSAVIYIRDVGCQFRNKNGTPGDSIIRSKTSSSSFDFADKKTDNYFTNIHTLRCEDKFTNPISGEELSMSTFSTSSLDIDIHCPSHGKQAFSRQKQLSTGFSPKSTNSPFVGVLTTVTNTPVQFSQCQKNLSKTNSTDTGKRQNSCNTKARRSCLRIKYKNVFSTTRRKKARSSNHVFSAKRNISYKKKL